MTCILPRVLPAMELRRRRGSAQSLRAWFAARQTTILLPQLSFQPRRWVCEAAIPGRCRLQACGIAFSIFLRNLRCRGILTRLKSPKQKIHRKGEEHGHRSPLARKGIASGESDDAHHKRCRDHVDEPG